MSNSASTKTIKGPAGATGATGSGISWTQHYIPDPYYWEDTGVNCQVIQSGAWRIGSTIYIFGGYLHGSSTTTNKIYTATDDGTGTVPTFVDSGATMPINDYGFRIIQLGSTLYAIGSQNTTRTICSASVSNPLVWTSLSATYQLPGQTANAPVVVLNGKVYVLAGYSGSAGLSTAYSATVSSFPTPTWSTTANIFTNGCWELGAGVIGSNLITVGGLNFTTTTTKFGSNRFPYQSVTTGTLPASQTIPEIYNIGNNVVMLGNNSTNVYTAQSGAETYGWATVGALPYAQSYTWGATWIGRDYRIYYVNNNATNKGRIIRSGRVAVYVPTTTQPTADGGLIGQFADGTPANVSSHVINGNPPWKYG